MKTTILVCAMTSLLIQCGALDRRSADEIQTMFDGYMVTLSPQERLMNSKQKDSIFRLEREKLDARRSQLQVREGAPFVGLAFSGGGIRSSAFHFGFLSGLHQSKSMARVDYVSSVSGGSWAAGAYKAMKQPTTRFRQIDAAIATEYRPGENDQAREIPYLFRDYDAQLLPFMQEQHLLLAPKGGFLRERWREMLQDSFLLDGDPLLSAVENTGSHAEIVDGQPELVYPPFLVLNAAHSAGRPFQATRPFEFTGLTVGTIHNVSDPSGLFFHLKQGYPPVHLSHAMAASSAVVYDISVYWNIGNHRLQCVDFAGLEWPFRTGLNERYGAFPREYVVSDGGHFENLGAFALVERGVSFIIVTDAAADPSQSFTDFQNLERRLEEELSVRLEARLTDCLRSGPNPTCSDDDSTGMVIPYSHRTIPEHRGFLLYLKPKKTQGFVRYLNASNLHYLVDFLNFNYLPDFPNDDTFSRAYSPQLIRLYYQMGKYMSGDKRIKCVVDAKDQQAVQSCLGK